VVDETLRYLGVPPKADPNVAPAAPAAPAVAATQPAEPGSAHGGQDRDDELADADEPAEPLLLPPGSMSGDMVTIPDFRGMSVKHALDVARNAGIAVDIEGSGRAVEQFPAPGPAPWPGECRIVFAPAHGVKEARAAAPSSAVRAAAASGAL
jgi:cell division protein FtsI (penicillin-binding protein 3)